MSDTEILKLAGALIASFLTGGGIVMLLVKRQFDAWDKGIAEALRQIADLETMLERRTTEYRVEFASMASRINTVEKQAIDDDKDVHARISELYKILPQEYARLDTIVDLRSRLTDMKREMEAGFDRLAKLIKSQVP